jgi:hypothetical protein
MQCLASKPNVERMLKSRTNAVIAPVTTHRWWPILRWMPLLICMAVIFWFSHQPGNAIASFGTWDLFIKKGAHMVGYGGLAIAAYIATLKVGEGLSEASIRDGYARFKKQKDSAELSAMATQHGLASAALQAFVDSILQRMILDADALTDLMAPLELGWKARAQAETALMKELVPLLTKRAQGREISGLSAYEH